MENKILKQAKGLVVKYSTHDITHQVDHIKRVLSLIKYLADKENVAEKIDWESLTLATIFHDLGSGQRIKKLKGSTDKFKSEEHSNHGFKMAQKFLQKEGVSKEQTEKIKQIIAAHEDGGKKDNIEGQLLHDADKLDGIGLVGILRIFAFGGQINRNILDTLKFIKQKMKDINFKTKSAQKLGRKRIKKVSALLREIDEELISLSVPA